MDGQDSEDPKSTADMTAFVQNLLQQMQSRFQTMSDSIVSKNILFIHTSACAFVTGKVYLALIYDELEQSINDLKAEIGGDGSPSPLPPSKVKQEETPSGSS
ncbi:hypothetical protein AMTR_s00019p00187710 [Amborella trichopoda]|uniref:Uncharacterized protein n=1 Tax=Amborella trichopoda TaxID=13333 RepID=W1PH04_AMBTC|nr:hypothetical protein AMTR_s00019p00187710 [Amborella trichopoda]